MNSRSFVFQGASVTALPSDTRASGTRRVLQFVLLLLCVLVWLGARGTVFAQAPRSITFNEAVNIALEQNVTLKQVSNAAELDAIAVAQQRMVFYPDLFVSSRGSQNYGRNFVPDEGRILNQTTEQFGVSVGSSVNLFNGFGDVAALRQAELVRQAGEYDYDRARQSVVFQVMSNYLLLIEQQEQIRVREENLAAQEQQLEQVEGLVEVGSRPPSDLYQQRAAVAGAELAVVEAERAYQITETTLIQILQLDPFGEYRFEVPDVPEDVDAGPQSDLDDLLREAFARRADLQAREQEIAAADEGIRVANATRWPTIGMNFGYGTNYNTADRFSLFDQFDQRRGGSVELSLRLPLFDRFATRHNLQRAEVARNNARLTLDDVRQDVAVQVRQARLDLLSAAKSLEVTETQEEAAAQALAVEEERYAVGVGTLVELSLARAEYVSAASSRVTAKYDYIFQTKLIDYYLGVLDPREPLF